MILIVTNRRDHTADFLIIELQRIKAEYLRFNTEDFPRTVQIVWHVDDNGLSGHFLFPNAKVTFQEIHSIWFRRPVPPVPHEDINDLANINFVVSESQITLEGIWRSLDCFWVSNPDNIRMAEIKPYQLKIASELGFKLSPTIITNDPGIAQEFYKHQDESIVYKPLRSSRIVRDREVSLIYTSPVGKKEAGEFNKVSYAPSMFQRYVHKLLDIRVTVIGSKVFAVAIHSQDKAISKHDWRRGDTANLYHEPHLLPPIIESQCIELVETLGLAFGAIDLILTADGNYVFLEINPNGQWAWIQQLCPDIPLRETLVDLLKKGQEGNDR